MKVYEKEFTIPQKNLWGIQEYVCLYTKMTDYELPIRFVVTENKDNSYSCEVGVIKSHSKGWVSSTADPQISSTTAKKESENKILSMLLY